jgi:hypothetical protein
MFWNALSAFEIFQKIGYVAFISIAKHSLPEHTVSFQFPSKIEILQTLELFRSGHIFNDGHFHSLGHGLYTAGNLGFQ